MSHEESRRGKFIANTFLVQIRIFLTTALTFRSSNRGVEKLYIEHVVSRTNSACSEKVVFDIDKHIVYEPDFVECFKPSGKMDPCVLYAQCFLWNQEWQDKVILTQEAIVSTLFLKTNNFLCYDELSVFTISF
ncbi:hypothetical protein ABZP36_000208 [Zizania latifolia]